MSDDDPINRNRGTPERKQVWKKNQFYIQMSPTDRTQLKLCLQLELLFLQEVRFGTISSPTTIFNFLSLSLPLFLTQSSSSLCSLVMWTHSQSNPPLALLSICGNPLCLSELLPYLMIILIIHFLVFLGC